MSTGPSKTDLGGRAGEGRERLCDRILVVITEDWFALSHFKPLLCELRALGRDVLVATRSSGRFDELAALGVQPVALDLGRGSLSPLVLLRGRRALTRLIDTARPDVVHAIALQPMVFTSLALSGAQYRPRAAVLHLTGMGYLGVSRALSARLIRGAAFGAMRRARRTAQPWLLAENADDLDVLVREGLGSAERAAIIPGAGVDPEEFAAQPPPRNGVPRAAFVGRMVRTKGVDVLVEAQLRLRERGIALDIDLYGAPDLDNPDGISSAMLAEWGNCEGVHCHGRVQDIVGVWRGADIAVVPSLGGEGMPRSMLEAAACARPLVVADVPGCRQFVRDGSEGLVVPPGDVEALAAALARLAAEPDLRRRQGLAARERLVAQFSTDAVRRALRDAYRKLLAASPVAAIGQET